MEKRASNTHTHSIERIHIYTHTHTLQNVEFLVVILYMWKLPHAIDCVVPQNRKHNSRSMCCAKSVECRWLRPNDMADMAIAQCRDVTTIFCLERWYYGPWHEHIDRGAMMM